MNKVIMTGWEEGLQKVSLTKLQVTQLGLSLRESKENVDHLLEGNEVIVYTNDSNKAKQFAKEAQQIGVLCHLASSQSSTAASA